MTEFMIYGLRFTIDALNDRCRVAASLFSLTPGFSPVSAGATSNSRFSGLCSRPKPLKRLKFFCRPRTGLKPGVNESFLE